jgi:hypothetical protein
MDGRLVLCKALDAPGEPAAPAKLLAGSPLFYHKPITLRHAS